MRTHLILLLALLIWEAETQSAQEKAILDLAPTLEELGEGWTTNVFAYLLDPQSQPSEIDHRNDPSASVLLEMQRQVMKTNSRTGCGLIFYGRGDLVMNSGLYRVYIQRWVNTRALHNSWVDWKMNPSRVVRPTPALGEDFFWTNEWWRQTPVRQNLVFRRRLFHVVIEAGIGSDPSHLVRLAEVIDAKIRGRPVPKLSGPVPDRAAST